MSADPQHLAVRLQEISLHAVGWTPRGAEAVPGQVSLAAFSAKAGVSASVR